MLAYAQYFNDARIKMYVHALLERGISVDVLCLEDDYSRGSVVGSAELTIRFVQKKYQGTNKARYVLSYLLFFVRASFLVTRLYLRKHYVTIHVHNQPDFIVYCAFIPKALGARVILDMHDIMIAALPAKFKNERVGTLAAVTKLQTWAAVSFCDVLLCADHSQQDFLIENQVVHRNMHVMLNLPDAKLFHRKVDKAMNRVPKAVYHGTVSYRLGLDLAIKAIEVVSQDLPIAFTIIGDGDQKADLVRYCQSRGILNTVVFFKDFIPVEDLQGELEQHDIGVVSNRRSVLSERCMLPVKLLEYAYIGLPVVAPRLAVIQRYFPEDSISYFEPENCEQLGANIIRLCRDEELRRRTMQTASRFFERHTVDAQLRQYFQLLQLDNGR